MGEHQRRSSFDLHPTAGVKRPAPVSTLLPGFDPCSSSPALLPRPVKRVARESSKSNPFGLSFGDDIARKQKYPTPVPSSDTQILSSSPPCPVGTRRPPPMQRNISALSERLPLCSVPTLKLDRNGEPVLLGRSGKSSHFQLSTNKLISRVHVRAAYVLPTPANAPQVEIKCTGWNGIKVHCKGSAWELGKSETFTSEEEGADIMIDVQDTRVVLQWPRLKKSDTPSDTESDTDGEGSPSRRAACNFIGKVRTHSPVRRAARLQSPLSPIPTARHVSLEAPPEPPLVQIYEDEPEDEELQGAREELEPTQSTIKLTQPVGSQTGLHALQSFKAPNFDSDQDEENDPVIQSFGPAGANLLPRLASFHTGISPDRRTTLGDIKQNSVSPRKRSTDGPKINLPTHPAVNHVVNQLAYSRLASTPLSTILNNLPQEMKVDKTKHGDGIEVDTETLRNLIESTQCIGEIKRAGKDAAGMPLESEYYYVADDDFDEDRRMAIGGLKKPGLRNCRKLHKQYFWRKPK